MTHKKILNLIENVSPNDTDMLDEIDARVGAYMSNIPWTRVGSDRGVDDYSRDLFYFDKIKSSIDADKCEPFCVRYTRSRDAQESLNQVGDVNRLLVSEFEGSCNATFHPALDAPVFDVRRIATKKLAELHVRLQAIAHKRVEV